MEQHYLEPLGNVADVAPTRRREKRSGLEHVQQFLVRFGYLPAGSYEEGLLDDITALALARYQERSGLTETGEFDERTRDEMTTPRCGLADFIGGVLFDIVRCAWDKNGLTYAFGQGTNQIPGDGEFQAVRKAFASWQAVIPVTFTEVAAGANPDILVEWRPAADPDYNMIGDVDAHSAFPPRCDDVASTSPTKPLHFDDTETRWRTAQEFAAVDVESKALHEIGHLLGIEHNTELGGSQTVMWPKLDTNKLKRVLTNSDILRARCLYWERLDANPATKQIVSSGGNLYQRHITGAVFQYSGTPMVWVPLDANPQTIEIVADGNQLYQRHGTGAILRYTGTPLIGWQQLDANQNTKQLAASGGNLYQRHSTGAILRYTGTPMTGWQQLDANPNTSAIVADGSDLYQLHSTGAIFKYTGVPFTGWQQLDANPATVQIVAAAGNLYQLHQGTGAVFRYTGVPFTGWQLLAADFQITEIGAAAGNLYRLLTTGMMCWATQPGTDWVRVAHPPAAGLPLPIAFTAEGAHIYRLHTDGAIMRYYN
jgi:hypothetical protein